MIINDDLTLRDVEKSTGISKSCLYENLDRDNEIAEAYDRHKRNSLNNYNNNIENGGNFNLEGSELSRRVTSKR